MCHLVTCISILLGESLPCKYDGSGTTKPAGTWGRAGSGGGHRFGLVALCMAAAMATASAVAMGGSLAVLVLEG